MIYTMFKKECVLIIEENTPFSRHMQKTIYIVSNYVLTLQAVLHNNS